MYQRVQFNEPSLLNEPAKQLAHTEAPLALLKVPASQRLQDELASNCAYAPGKHGVQFHEPTLLIEPAKQTAHVEAPIELL